MGLVEQVRLAPESAEVRERVDDAAPAVEGPDALDRRTTALDLTTQRRQRRARKPCVTLFARQRAEVSEEEGHAGETFVEVMVERAQRESRLAHRVEAEPRRVPVAAQGDGGEAVADGVRGVD